MQAMHQATFRMPGETVRGVQTFISGNGMGGTYTPPHAQLTDRPSYKPPSCPNKSNVRAPDSVTPRTGGYLARRRLSKPPQPPVSDPCTNAQAGGLKSISACHLQQKISQEISTKLTWIPFHLPGYPEHAPYKSCSPQKD